MPPASPILIYDAFSVLSMADSGLKMGCGFIVMIISVIMLAVSFSVITPHQYGIHYRNPTYSLDHSVWENGRWFLGLGHSFFTYPKKYEYKEYSNSDEGGSNNKPITCWTKNGQELIIEVLDTSWGLCIARDRLQKYWFCTHS